MAERWLAIAPRAEELGDTPEQAAENLIRRIEDPFDLPFVRVVPASALRTYEASVYRIPDGFGLEAALEEAATGEAGEEKGR